MSLPTPISKPKLLLVEGIDEENLFNELLKRLELFENIQVVQVGGKDKFKDGLNGLKKVSNFNMVKSIGIVRDADRDPSGAFQSVCSSLANAELPYPSTPLQVKTGPPDVSVLILPNSNTPGMLENICLESVSDDPAISCVESFFQCLQTQQRILAENDIPKARVRAYLTSREWLEMAHYEYLQSCMEHYEPNPPISPATIVTKVHAFLASRYTPDLRLGEAARRSDREDVYWRFDHPAFDQIKQFLRML